MNKLIVTTSWDDGNKLDLRIANLLKKYNLKGTFYVPVHYEKRDLEDNDIIELSKDFEIGSHSCHHRKLTGLSKKEIVNELENSKIHLENLLSKEIISFSYPFGSYNSEVEKLVSAAGYKLSRTIEYNYTSTLSNNPFRTQVSCYLSNKENCENLIKLALNLRLELFTLFDWEAKAKALFDILSERGGTFHLWGHSWEYNDFEKLERVLMYISDNKNCIYVTNAEMVK